MEVMLELMSSSQAPAALAQPSESCCLVCSSASSWGRVSLNPIQGPCSQTYRKITQSRHSWTWDSHLQFSLAWFKQTQPLTDRTLLRVLEP